VLTTGGRARGDRGSALMLMPACVLVVLVLASIAVDFALVHLRQRQAFDLAAGAANDAVTAGVDQGRLREGHYRLDRGQVEEVVRRSIAASQLADHLVRPPEVRMEGDAVEVVLTVEADYVFSGVIPGAPDRTVVTAMASATAIAN
jgi:hypothetical protein